MSNLALVDLSTGEVLMEGVAECKTFEQAQRANKFGQRKKSQHEDTLAGRYFTFMMLEGVKKEEYTLGALSELGAFIVLSTYVEQDSEGTGKALLPFETIKGGIDKALKCSQSQANKMWTALEKLGLAYREGDKMFLNSDVVYRGSTNRKDIAKVWHINTRELLDNGCKLADIGVLFLTAPYLHRETNYLCSNPDARQDEPIQHIGITELAGLIGVNPKTLSNKFKKMVVKYDGKRTPLYLKANSPLSKIDMYIMNPLVINRGMTNSGIDELFKRLAY